MCIAFLRVLEILLQQREKKIKVVAKGEEKRPNEVIKAKSIAEGENEDWDLEKENYKAGKVFGFKIEG